MPEGRGEKLCRHGRQFVLCWQQAKEMLLHPALYTRRYMVVRSVAIFGPVSRCGHGSSVAPSVRPLAFITLWLSFFLFKHIHDSGAALVPFRYVLFWGESFLQYSYLPDHLQKLRVFCCCWWPGRRRCWSCRQDTRSVTLNSTRAEVRCVSTLPWPVYTFT